MAPIPREIKPPFRLTAVKALNSRISGSDVIYAASRSITAGWPRMGMAREELPMAAILSGFMQEVCRSKACCLSRSRFSSMKTAIKIFSM
ncbi:MAG TPA: hypothetical protein DCG70_07930 [Lachnoclostridium sp.]|nr:hypothetical protein [Lachnoclostridium sp.]